MMMWITGFLFTLLCFPGLQATDLCRNLESSCTEDNVFRPGCYEDKIATCTTPKSRMPPDFIRMRVNSSDKLPTRVVVPAGVNEHTVQIPASALSASGSEEDVLLVVSVLNSTLFTPKPPRNQSAHRQGTVLGQSVLLVRVGNQPLSNLAQPIVMTFKHNNQTGDGICVFWQYSPGDGRGTWEDKGCKTVYNDRDFICSCNHLSFFAVLVNTKPSVSRADAVLLGYISVVGSSLSVFLTVISLVTYTWLQRARADNTLGVHMQLTAALFCLHLSFLLSRLWAWLQPEGEGGCRALGLLLHWSLLATFSWMALEGFHLYLLLVRVFNIYVRRYLLKLGLLGWGVPTVVVLTCGILHSYGKCSITVNDNNSNNNNTSAFELCWISSDASIPGSAERQTLVLYITVVAYLGLVLLFNTAMLGVVVVKLWQLRGKGWGAGGGQESGWKRLQKERRAQLWKDCATVLGLGVVLGLPWGLACTTYSSTPGGLYLFTTLNALQGVFVFLWCAALTCKSHADTSTTSSSVKDPSAQKMVETSFNNSH